MAKAQYWIRHVGDAIEAEAVARAAAQQGLGLLDAERGTKEGGMWLVFATGAPLVTNVVRAKGDQRPKQQGSIPEGQRIQPMATEIANEKHRKGLRLRRLIAADDRIAWLLFGPDEGVTLEEAMSEAQTPPEPPRPTTPPPPPQPASDSPSFPTPPADDDDDDGPL